MSTKRRIFTAKFKTKIVLEVLKGEKTLNEIASKNNITPKNANSHLKCNKTSQNYATIFLETSLKNISFGV